MVTCEDCGFKGQSGLFRHPLHGVYLMTGLYICKDYQACKQRIQDKKDEDQAWVSAEKPKNICVR